MDTVDVAELLDGLQHYNHHDGGAVGVGDDATGAVEGVLGIDLGHYQWHVLVHAEGAGIVNHHRAVLGDGLGKLLGSAATGRNEGYIYIAEVVVVLEQLDFVLFTFESVFGTCAALGAKQYQLIDGKLSLCENTKKLLSNGATRAHNCYFHFVYFLLIICYRVQNYNIWGTYQLIFRDFIIKCDIFFGPLQ